MSIFATIAVVCAFSFATDKNECNDYVIDHAYTVQEGNVNTQVKDDEFLALWGDEELLNDWIKRYNVGASPSTIESIEFETQEIQEDMIP